ncbi:ABC transporter permease [Sporosarcina limicola]|uniref:ABC transport system permease protein n=1 Tax=Sporosarcina limicola TaxID=34101 RepID=A0A927MJ79_9BACL|nr:ABC transporter permease [Sporosarcina limicola]MBE1553962.1 putative ABC transport system permease protein [Sporosarcina limicola]
MRNNNQAIIKKVSQRYYRANRTRNIVLACAIILTTVLITAACSIFYNYSKLSTHQELKENGTTANAVLSRPTQKQIDLLRGMDILQPELNIQYKLGSLIGNQGQAGIDVNMISATNWEQFSLSLVDNMQGAYPTENNEVMMSTWLLNRLGISTPQVGMGIPLSVGINDIKMGGGAEVQTLSFTLSGFYEDTANISTENKRVAFFSEALLEEYPQNTPDLVGFFFKDISGYQDKMEQVQTSVVIGENQHLIPSYDGKLNMSVKNFFIAALVVLFFMFDGYLIIYNVAYISITRDVRFYGLLKTLGMTYKQIKNIVYRNAFRTALFALPVGILLGWVLSFYVVPLALSSFAGAESMNTQVNSWVLLISAIFSLLTMFMSYRAPAQKAGKTSPIEASKFTALKNTKQISKGRKNAKIPYMALKNILRNKKRVFIVVLTLFLGTSTLLTLMTFLKSFSVEEYINAEVKYDIAMYNHVTRASFSPTEEQHFTPELMAQISAVDGIREMEKTTVVSIYQHYSDPIYSEWLRIANEFKGSMGEELRDKTLYEEDPRTNFWGLLIGIDDKKVEEYNRTAETPIDIEAFSKGQISLVTDINGSGIPIGAKIPFTVIDSEKTFEVTVGGQMTFARDSMNSGAAPWLIVSNHVINNYHPDAVLYSVKVNAKIGEEQDVLDAITLITSSDHSISRTSKIEQAKAFDDLKRSFSYLAVVITIILSSVGILNFMNTMIVSVLSRKQELAVFAAIGATKKQIKRLITFEGLWYALITFTFTLTVGSGINYLAFHVIRENLGFGTFTYPIVPLLLYTCVVFFLCGIIPLLLYRLVSRESVVERLREVG